MRWWPLDNHCRKSTSPRTDSPYPEKVDREQSAAHAHQLLCHRACVPGSSTASRHRRRHRPPASPVRITWSRKSHKKKPPPPRFTASNAPSIDAARRTSQQVPNSRRWSTHHRQSSIHRRRLQLRVLVLAASPATGASGCRSGVDGLQLSCMWLPLPGTWLKLFKKSVPHLLEAVAVGSNILLPRW